MQPRYTCAGSRVRTSIVLGMSAVRGTIYALFAFDVAEAIDLTALAASVGDHATLATIYDKAPGTSQVRYMAPPVMVDGAALGHGELDGFRVRLKFYDYGVVSIALTRTFDGEWSAFVDAGQRLMEDETLAAQAERVCRAIVERARAAMTLVRPVFLGEDYAIFAVRAADPGATAEQLLAERGGDIAQLLRAEREPLSAAEREETLRHRISYLSCDLVIPAWNAAFVHESESDIPATIELLEFANSQLLEFRYHDERLEAALVRIYADLQHPRWTDGIIGRRHLRATRELHSLIIDVNELTDHLENALKLVGDVYSARLLTLAGARLGLDRWKQNVQNKLNTLNDIYRFAVEQTRVSQGNILELVIVCILVFELGLTLKDLLLP
jgi:hypothetical protein